MSDDATDLRDIAHAITLLKRLEPECVRQLNRANSELAEQRLAALRTAVKVEKLRQQIRGKQRGIDRLRRRLDRVRREASGQAGWVPVDKALPRVTHGGEEFLVRVQYVADGRRHHAFEVDLFDGVEWHLSYPGRSNTAVTHWRPLPPGPEDA